MPHRFFCFLAGGEVTIGFSSWSATIGFSLFGFGDSGVGGIEDEPADGVSTLTSSVGFIKSAIASVMGAVGLSDISRAKVGTQNPPNSFYTSNKYVKIGTSSETADYDAKTRQNRLWFRVCQNNYIIIKIIDYVSIVLMWHLFVCFSDSIMIALFQKEHHIHNHKMRILWRNETKYKICPKLAPIQKIILNNENFLSHLLATDGSVSCSLFSFWTSFLKQTYWQILDGHFFEKKFQKKIRKNFLTEQ